MQGPESSMGTRMRSEASSPPASRVVGRGGEGNVGRERTEEHPNHQQAMTGRSIPCARGWVGRRAHLSGMGHPGEAWHPAQRVILADPRVPQGEMASRTAGSSPPSTRAGHGKERSIPPACAGCGGGGIDTGRGRA